MIRFLTLFCFILVFSRIVSADIIQQDYTIDYHSPYQISSTIEKNILNKFQNIKTLTILVSFKDNPHTNFTSFHQAYDIASHIQLLFNQKIRTIIKLVPETDHPSSFKLTLSAN